MSGAISKQKDLLKSIVKSGYDLQKIRIQIGNRVVASFKHKLGQKPGMTEEEMEKEAQNLLSDLRKSYLRLADAMPKVIRQKNFKGDGLITSFAEYSLVSNYNSVLEAEERQFKDAEKILVDFKIYREFLSKVKGCGPMMSAIIISELDPYKAEYPSQFWKYAGLDVGPDNRGRGRYSEHLVEIEYINKEGEKAIKKGITFNPFLKTKLLGVLASSFLKSKSEYSAYYYNYKNRLENHPVHKEKTPKHRHNMAMRYMIKRFLVDLHVKWRELEGLPVAKEYSEAKLGIIHGQAK